MKAVGDWKKQVFAIFAKTDKELADKMRSMAIHALDPTAESDAKRLQKAIPKLLMSIRLRSDEKRAILGAVDSTPVYL